MTITVLKGGVMDTIQDDGRYGFARLGVNFSGTMDRYAAHVANALVGNDLGTPVVELHFPASEFHFDGAAIISITGADFSAFANGVPLPTWRTIAISSDTVVSFKRKNRGSRAYLAVHGTPDTEPWLGSASTNMKVGLGGVGGRALRKDDRLVWRGGEWRIHDAEEFSIFPWTANIAGVYADDEPVSFIRGNEWGWLAPASAEEFEAIEFRISPSSDRMAIRLDHKPLAFAEQEDMLSSGVSFGTIQAPPGGSLMILMADHQTTGGYPRIGHVVGAHLPRLAQLGANESFRLTPVTPEDAEKLLLSQQRDVRRIQRSCLDHLREYYAAR